MGSAGGAAGANTDAFFIPLLDRELHKICLFYDSEEQRLSDETTALQQEIEQQEASGPYAGHEYEDEEGDEEEEDDEFDLHSPIDQSNSPTRRRRRRSRSVSVSAPGVPSGM